jgi:hypothetical protein
MVGGKVGHSEAFGLAMAERNVHLSGLDALYARNLLGVEAELEEVIWLGMSRKFRVHRLVAPVRLSNDEVCKSTPVIVGEAGLVDDIDA